MGNHDLINIHLVITFKWKKLGFHILLVHYLWWNSLERTMIIHRRRNGWGGEGVAPPPIFFLQSYTNHKKNFLFFGPRISDKSTPAPLMTLTYNFKFFLFLFYVFVLHKRLIIYIIYIFMQIKSWKIWPHEIDLKVWFSFKNLSNIFFFIRIHSSILIITDNEPFYYVEKIIDKRKKNGKTEFLVKWEGYEDPTWEPERNIPSHIIEEFLN